MLRSKAGWILILLRVIHKYTFWDCTAQHGKLTFKLNTTTHHNKSYTKF